MNYGLYLSAAGALTSLHRQDVIANNLANMNTVGFKPDMATTRQRLPERIEDLTFTDPQYLLEKLGGGLFSNPTMIQLSQGSLMETGNSLDLALQGDGFFVVSDGSGTGGEHLRLTRDGRFMLNADGQLVMAGTGMKVLNENDQAITLDRKSPIMIDQDGTIRQNDQVVDRIQIAAQPEPELLVKAGDSLFRIADGESYNPGLGEASVHQGFLEASSVDPISTLTAMIAATKAVQANAKMMQYHDNTLGQVMNTFSRIS